MKFFIRDFFSIYEQIWRKLRIWSYLLKKSLMENFIFVQWIEIICNASFVFKMKSCVLNKFSSSVEQSVSIIDYFAQASLTKFCTANIFRIKRADIKNMKSFSRFMVKYYFPLQFSPVGRDMSTLEAWFLEFDLVH